MACSRYCLCLLDCVILARVGCGTLAIFTLSIQWKLFERKYNRTIVVRACDLKLVASPNIDSVMLNFAQTVIGTN